MHKSARNYSTTLIRVSHCGHVNLNGGSLPSGTPNQANTFVEGSLELVGKNEPQMDGVFFRAGETGINSTYTLASKGCQDFKLMLTPLNLDGFDAKLTIHASSQVLGQTVRDVSQELRAEVGGPELAPDGMDLGILELNNKNSIISVSYTHLTLPTKA